MLDRIESWIPDGGPQGLGYIRATRRVTAVDEGRRLLHADGYLSVDGRVIYGMKEFTLRHSG